MQAVKIEAVTLAASMIYYLSYLNKAMVCIERWIRKVSLIRISIRIK